MLRPKVPDWKGAGSESLPLESTDGRSVFEVRSLFVSCPVRMLKGRPEDISKMGATMKSAKKLRQPPSPRQVAGDASTPLKTKRWRWSNKESARSRSSRVTSCGSRSVCKSDESSMACDQV